MPIYEYQCEGCGDVFEETQKISDPPLKKHAACGSKKVKKLISMTSFQLKGEGWYVTDYKKRPAEETEAKPKVEAKVDAKTDAKTETKTEAKAQAKAEPAEPKSSVTRRKQPPKQTKPAKKKPKGRAA